MYLGQHVLLIVHVIGMYREGDVVGKYPLFINYKGEQAVDQGGVQRDMRSAFWAETYTHLFEGAIMLTPIDTAWFGYDHFS